MRLRPLVLLSLVVLGGLSCDEPLPSGLQLPPPSFLSAEFWECDPPDLIICDLHAFESSHYQRAQQAIADIGEYTINPQDDQMCSTLQGIAQSNLQAGEMRYWSNAGADPEKDADFHHDATPGSVAGKVHFREFSEGSAGLQAHEAYHEYIGPGGSEWEDELNEAMASYYQEACG